MKPNPIATHILLTLAAMFAVGTAAQPRASAAERPPNIVILYADDLGYGDVGCYGATAVKTPNVDALAKSGLRFTSGYCASATCTPSRYTLLTGEYPFRQKGTGVLPGDAGLIIAPGRATLPSLLKPAGYTTAVVGKWHLGLGETGKIDWNGDIKPCPLDVGFDYSFIMAATGDRVPCVYVEDRRVVGLVSEDPILVGYKEPFPGERTGQKDRESLKMDWSHGHNMAVVNGIGRIGCFLAGCCYGKPTTLPWRITFTSPLAATNVGTPLGIPLHPTQVYEASAELLILGLLLATERRGRRFAGRTFWLYMLLYAISRYVIEFFRGDPRGEVQLLQWTISTSQVISLVLAPLSLVMLVFLSRVTTGEPQEARRKRKIAA